MNNTLWLTNAYLTEYKDIAEWNRNLPKVHYHFPVNISDWPEISYWGTPSFYFFKDGALIRKVVGWRRDEEEAQDIKLRAGFKAIGITLPSESQTSIPQITTNGGG